MGQNSYVLRPPQRDDFILVVRVLRCTISCSREKLRDNSFSVLKILIKSASIRIPKRSTTNRSAG